ncbi:MAG: hypothetical protein QXM86_03670 [Candidatus Bathyarchaeia archaeon]
MDKFSKFLEGLSPTETVDILHLFRIRYAQHYKDLSNEIFLKFRDKLKPLTDGGGVYVILIVDYLGDAILYIGRTSGKSKTSGLRFRLQDHTKLLGKTPLTVFIPNWWIKKVYAIPIDDRAKAKELEDTLWAFLVKNVENQSQFHSLNELENKIYSLISSHGLSLADLKSIVLQPERELRSPFILRCPPAGQPRNLIKVR